MLVNFGKGDTRRSVGDLSMLCSARCSLDLGVVSIEFLCCGCYRESIKFDTFTITHKRLSSLLEDCIYSTEML